MRQLSFCAMLALVLAPGLRAQDGDSGAILLRECESRIPVVGPMRATGRVTALIDRGGRIDTASTRVLEVESVSIAGFRSAAARMLSTCRFRMSGERSKEPVPVEIALEFQGGPTLVGAAVPVAALAEGLEPGPVLLPTQDLPLAPEDRRIEESPLPERGCNVWRDFGGARYYRSVDEAYRDINTQLEQRRGRLQVEFELDRDGRVVESSVRVLMQDNAKAAEHFVKTIRRCRYSPARIGGLPVPVRMTMAVSSRGPV